jgi:hypothetical protein
MEIVEWDGQRPLTQIKRAARRERPDGARRPRDAIPPASASVPRHEDKPLEEVYVLFVLQ